MADLKDLKGALVFAMKFEAAPASNTKGQTPHTSRQRIGHVELKKQTGRRPLNAGPAVEKGICRSCRARQGAETNSASQKGGVGKLINGHLVGRRLPDFGKPHFQVCQISTKSTDIADPFILGLDFLKEHGFTLDFNKNELRSIHEEVTIFKIEHRSEPIRQVTANENITIPPRTEIIVPGYIGNDVSFNSGLIGSAENKANGLLIALTLVDLSEKLSRNVCLQSSSLLLSNSPQQLTPDLLENVELSPNRKAPQKKTVQEFEDVFSRNSSDIGHTTVTQHRIDTADHPPIKQHPRRLPFAKQEEVGTLLREMQENDIIEPSSSPWASQSSWFKDSYPLPRIDDTLDTLSGHKWFSTLDLKSGYWQVEIHPEDREKTAFTSGQGLWQFKVMPFGLCNAPATFERLMETVLKGRCSYGPRKVSAVKNWKRPENLRELRSFLGLCTYYRKFVKGFSNIARPLHKLTESKQKFQWTKECEDSFLQLKEALTSSPILIYPQPDKPFILDTDASNESVGAVLSQEIDGQERVVAYWSQVARWIQRLNEYYFDIRHRKGSSHGNADALSRRPCPENCRHCSRVETKYDYAIRQITTSTATPPDPWVTRKFEKTRWRILILNPL
ncbi:retrovirus-related Pol polyprotein from transposon 412 [Trichonephila clavipes]|nr:retrovirus-related Pol polyprotein from transposon 412 [Trichonephila clavipes]